MKSDFISINPATGEELWRGTIASEKDVDVVVSAAGAAQGTWQRCSVEERISFLEKFASILESKKNDFAETISKEMGKTFLEANGEVLGMIKKVPLTIKAYEERCQERTDVGGTTTRFKPHGIVAVFGAFNFPGHLPAGHIIPALLLGNTVVFKPSEKTPLVGEMFYNLWQKSGLPDGVLNLIQGEKDTGISLANHPGINGLFFTGSSKTGRAIHKSFAGDTGKILALEMGGNNPLVCWQTDDLKNTAELIINSAFVTSGQRCSCARRLIISDAKEGEEIIVELQKKIPSIVVGAYDSSPEPFMGPVIDEEAGMSLLAVQSEMQANGGVSLVEMKTLDGQKNMLSPGLIDVSKISNRKDEELFGPLLQVIRVGNFEEALEEANNTAYGLTAALISAKKELYQEFFQTIRAGIINWNKPTTGASSTAPFGGVGASGNFRPSGYFAVDYCGYPVVSSEVK